VKECHLGDLRADNSFLLELVYRGRAYFVRFFVATRVSPLFLPHPDALFVAITSGLLARFYPHVWYFVNTIAAEFVAVLVLVVPRGLWLMMYYSLVHHIASRAGMVYSLETVSFVSNDLRFLAFYFKLLVMA
jgi:hypothetical protein